MVLWTSDGQANIKYKRKHAQKNKIGQASKTHQNTNTIDIIKPSKQTYQEREKQNQKYKIQF